MSKMCTTRNIFYENRQLYKLVQTKKNNNYCYMCFGMEQKFPRIEEPST